MIKFKKAKRVTEDILALGLETGRDSIYVILYNETTRKIRLGPIEDVTFWSGTFREEEII